MPNIADQYRIIAAGAGWRRRDERGRLRFAGADRLQFLQALVTNDVAGLRSGEGAYAAYLTPQGRMITDLHIFARADHVLADVPASLAADLALTFDRLVFAEDVSVEDASQAWTQWQIVGGDAARVLAKTFAVDRAQLSTLPVWSLCDAGAGFVARTDDSAIASYDVWLPAALGTEAARMLENAGAVSVLPDFSESLRIDAGRPSFGIDMDRDTIPLEAGLLERAISTTKGCYVGQEIVIRILHRGGGRVARRLVRLAIAPGPAVAPATGAIVTIDGREVGRITSAAESPHGSGYVALAYVHRDDAEVGRQVSIADESAAALSWSGEITALAG